MNLHSTGQASMENQKHVAVLPFPFASHPFALLTLTRLLAAAAPNVMFSFFNTARSNSSVFTSKNDDRSSNMKVYDVEDGVPVNYFYGGGKPVDLFEMFERVTPENYKKAIKKAVLETGRDITCFIADALVWQAADMAEEMNVPWISYWVALPSSLVAHIHTDLIRDKIAALGDQSGRKELPLDFLPGMPPALRIKDTPKEILDRDFDPIFERAVYHMNKLVTRGPAVAFDYFEELDPSTIRTFTTESHKWLAVGPLNLLTTQSALDPNGCITWLNKQTHASVVYICFGTVTTPPPNEIIALSEALEETRVPFIWVLKENMKVHLPEGFLDRTSEKGMVVSWTTQSQLLQHPAVGVFVSHGGWHSILESIIGGVPMIYRPFFGDQTINGRLLSDVWGIGVEAKDGVLSKDGLISSLELILSKEEGKKMRKNIGAMKELAMQAVGPKGSSTMNFRTLLEMVTTTKPS